MDRIDVENFAKNLVLALAQSGKLADEKEAVDTYSRFIDEMDRRGNIDPPEDDEEDDEEVFYEQE